MHVSSACFAPLNKMMDGYKWGKSRQCTISAVLKNGSSFEQVAWRNITGVLRVLSSAKPLVTSSNSVRMSEDGGVRMEFH